MVEFLKQAGSLHWGVENLCEHQKQLISFRVEGEPESGPAALSRHCGSGLWVGQFRRDCTETALTSQSVGCIFLQLYLAFSFGTVNKMAFLILFLDSSGTSFVKRSVWSDAEMQQSSLCWDH